MLVFGDEAAAVLVLDPVDLVRYDPEDHFLFRRHSDITHRDAGTRLGGIAEAYALDLVHQIGRGAHSQAMMTFAHQILEFTLVHGIVDKAELPREVQVKDRPADRRFYVGLGTPILRIVTNGRQHVQDFLLIAFVQVCGRLQTTGLDQVENLANGEQRGIAQSLPELVA